MISRDFCRAPSFSNCKLGEDSRGDCVRRIEWGTVWCEHSQCAVNIMHLKERHVLMLFVHPLCSRATGRLGLRLLERQMSTKPGYTLCPSCPRRKKRKADSWNKSTAESTYLLPVYFSCKTFNNSSHTVDPKDAPPSDGLVGALTTVWQSDNSFRAL